MKKANPKLLYEVMSLLRQSRVPSGQTTLRHEIANRRRDRYAQRKYYVACAQLFEAYSVLISVSICPSTSKSNCCAMPSLLYVLLLAAIAVTAADLVPTNCAALGSAAYFDAASLSCQPCGGAGFRPANTSGIWTPIAPLFGPTSCTCSPGYATSAAQCATISSSNLLGCPPPVCTACGPNAAPSTASVPNNNASACMPCGGSTLGLDAATGECACFPANATSGTSVLVETDAAGVRLPAKQCLACPPRTRVFALPTGSRLGSRAVCVACADPHASMSPLGACVCDAGWRPTGNPAYASDGGVVCVDAVTAASLLTTSEAAAATVAYWSVQTSTSSAANGATTLTLVSAVVQHFFLGAVVGCAAAAPGDLRGAAACQTLANLCVLNLYSLAAQPCAQYAAIAAARGAGTGGTNGIMSWPTSGSGAPFLTYLGAENAGAARDTALSRVYGIGGGWGTGSVLTGGGIAGGGAFSSDTLTFILARYSLNGTFNGLQRLTTQFSSHCGGGGGGSTDPSWLRFGHSAASSYSCDVGKLLLAGVPALADSADLPAPYPLPSVDFYDLYIEDTASDLATHSTTLGGGTTLLSTAASMVVGPGGTLASIAAAKAALSSLYADVAPPMALYPVPVRILNYRAADGSLPNVNAVAADVGNDVHVRRFMLVDAGSGVVAPGTPPSVIRYASSLTLSVIARPGRPVTIYVPTLTVGYRERVAGVVVAAVASRGSGDTAAGAMGFDSLSLTVEYSGDTSAYSSTVTALAATLGALCGVHALLRTVAWTRRNARTPLEVSIGASHGARLVLYTASSFAVAFFWLLWLACAYWVVYTKLQGVNGDTFVLPPALWPPYSANECAPFAALLVAVFAAYAARVVAAIARQVTCDVFFLDWERPRGATLTLSLAGGSASTAQKQLQGQGQMQFQQRTVGVAATTTTTSTSAYSSSSTHNGGYSSSREGGGGGEWSGRSGGGGGGTSASAALPGGYGYNAYAAVPLQSPLAPPLPSATPSSIWTKGGTQTINGGGTSGGGGVSVWRTLFAANEWGHLATARRTSPALTFLLLVYLLAGGGGLGLERLATPQPDPHDLSATSVGVGGPTVTLHPLLQFGNTVFWALVIIAAQRLYVWAVGERWVAESPALKFIDACTLAKVSVLVLDDRYHGFYLHCNAPHERADCDMWELADKLGEEAEAVRMGRGLPGCPDPSAQVFELHFPAAWREAYDGIFRRVLESESSAVEAAITAAGQLPPQAQAQQQQQQQQQQEGGEGGGGGSYVLTPAARGRERARRLRTAFTSLSAFLRVFVEDGDPAFKR